ncbi:MAG TPA: LPXTG cell wall anchor domain-containing protein, partial [Desulfitobacterium dehalogenans]|nr:LPXTG cell wall anchor domain-containing protein [Desulfitobacterium dehalogenans]
NSIIFFGGGGWVVPPNPVQPQEPIPGENPPQEGVPQETIPQENPPKVTTPKETPKAGTVKVPTGGTVEVSKPPQHGKVTIEKSGKWIYTPDPGFIGEDKFSIKVTKPDGTEEEVLIEIDVEKIPLGASQVPSADNGGSGKELPKTGESSKVGFYLAGLSLVLLGLVLRRKTV